jgi:hypothetical protein
MLNNKPLNGKPKYLALSKHGYRDKEDWKPASQIAAMEADLDHPEWDKLFDSTLTKYGIGNTKYALASRLITDARYKSLTLLKS